VLSVWPRRLRERKGALCGSRTFDGRGGGRRVYSGEECTDGNRMMIENQLGSNAGCLALDVGTASHLGKVM
jgi:hypothetical protein